MRIKVKNLRLKTIIGMHAWEENVKRDIIINAQIDTDYTDSTITDDIEDTIDYAKIVDSLKNIAKKRFKLVEKMAQEMVNEIMKDKKVKKCQLELDKVGALEDLESFSVSLRAKRKDG